MAEQICTKFTGKTCLVPSYDKFECQSQRSRSPQTKNGKLLNMQQHMGLISPELLNGFVPNTQGRYVWTLARTSLNVKGQGHQGQNIKICTVQHTNRTNLLQTTSCISRRDHSVAAGGDFGGLRAVYVW